MLLATESLPPSPFKHCDPTAVHRRKPQGVPCGLATVFRLQGRDTPQGLSCPRAIVHVYDPAPVPPEAARRLSIDEGAQHRSVLGLRSVFVGWLTANRVETGLKAGIALDRRSQPPADAPVLPPVVQEPDPDIRFARQPVSEQREPVARLRLQAARRPVCVVDRRQLHLLLQAVVDDDPLRLAVGVAQVHPQRVRGLEPQCRVGTQPKPYSLSRSPRRPACPSPCRPWPHCPLRPRAPPSRGQRPGLTCPGRLARVGTNRDNPSTGSSLTRQ